MMLVSKKILNCEINKFVWCDLRINQRTFRTTSEPSHEQVTNFFNYLIDTIKNVDGKLICQWIWI